MRKIRLNLKRFFRDVIYRIKSFGSWTSVVIIAFLAAMIFRSFFVEIFFIPSGSMYSDLVVGDHIIVSKYSYGYSKYSFPFSPNIFGGGRIFDSKPHRGDKIVFRQPKEVGIDYIKRLVGLPGDEIQMIGGVLNINGVPVKKRYVEDYYVINLPRSERAEKELELNNSFGDFKILNSKNFVLNGVEMKANKDYSITYWSDEECKNVCGIHKYKKYVETMPEGKSYFVLERSDNEMMDNTPVYKVPAGNYFFMGDNRDNSQDSRFLDALGYVPEENLIGRARFVLYSYSRSARIWEFWRWGNSMRWNRMFKSVESYVDKGSDAKPVEDNTEILNGFEAGGVLPVKKKDLVIDSKVVPNVAPAVVPKKTK